MPQYEALTGRRPRSKYADIVQAELPSARQRYWSGLAKKQAAEQFDEEMGLRKDELKLQAENAEQMKKQNDTSNTIAAASLAMPVVQKVAPFVKGAISGLGSGGSAAADLYPTILSAEGTPVIAGGAPGTVTTAAPTISTAAPTIPAATPAAAPAAAPAAETAAAGGAEAGGSGAGMGGGAATAAYIAAIIAAQHALTNSTGTKFEGQNTGDVFTMNDEGNWNPRFGNEPWHGFLNDKLGNEPSAGEKFDAAVYNQDWSKAAMRLPSTVQQWADPIGDALYDTQKGTIDAWSDQWGLGLDDQTEDVIMTLINPVSAVGNFIEDLDPSYLCSATKKLIGIDKIDFALLGGLYRYALRYHKPLGRFYLKHGNKLVKAISRQISDIGAFYSVLKKNMIEPIIHQLRLGDQEKAYQIYKAICFFLFKEFTPDTHKEWPKEA